MPYDLLHIHRITYPERRKRPWELGFLALPSKGSWRNAGRDSQSFSHTFICDANKWALSSPWIKELPLWPLHRARETYVKGWRGWQEWLFCMCFSSFPIFSSQKFSKQIPSFGLRLLFCISKACNIECLFTLCFSQGRGANGSLKKALKAD